MLSLFHAGTVPIAQAISGSPSGFVPTYVTRIVKSIAVCTVSNDTKEFRAVFANTAPGMSPLCES